MRYDFPPPSAHSLTLGPFGSSFGSTCVHVLQEPDLIKQLENIVRKLDVLEQDRKGIPEGQTWRMRDPSEAGGGEGMPGGPSLT